LVFTTKILTSKSLMVGVIKRRHFAKLTPYCHLNTHPNPFISWGSKNGRSVCGLK